MSFVALHCTCSILVICFLRNGAQIWFAYSRCGLISALKGYKNFFYLGIQR